jgi:predicted nucleotide-binding protein
VASRTSQRQPPERPLPQLRVPLAEAERLVGEQLDRGRDLRDRAITDRSALGAAHSSYSTWVEYNRDLLRRILSTDEVAVDFGRSARMMYSLGASSMQEDLADYRADIGVHVRRLESVCERLPLYSAPLATAHSVGQPAASSVDLRRVFVVHGRDLAAVDRVVRLLSDLSLEAVVLREQPNEGRTVIEKFEAHSDVAYAIVLLTGDDIGGLADSKPEELRLRARQNVILELGFFIGRLGRKKVAALEDPGVERPSDIDGVLYVPFDAGDTWRLLLAKEMKAAGLSVDLNLL